jgi:NAD(P)-dependent dehydrogenase (short-subunit alcohol dehydrogenase family)
MTYTKKLRGATAVVTGGASGLGRAFSVELGKLGAKVLLTDIDLVGAEETAVEVEREGGRARAVRADVASFDRMREVADEARDYLGDVDLLINNAGIGAGGPFESMTMEDWHHVVDVNLWGVIHGCHLFVPRMKERGRGYLINVASSAGLLALPEMSSYNVTKAGVVALSETLHGELTKHGVHVTALCPTFFQTRILESSRGVVDEETRASIAKIMRKSRIQAPDVARAALESVVKNELYSVPMRDGALLWRLKRALPGRFYAMLAQMDHRGLFARLAKR